jgi:hypothetical protein
LADGKLKIGEYVVNYQWIDGPRGGFFRRIFFEVFDPNFALQSFCRGLEIKKRELEGTRSPHQNPLSENKGLNGGIIFLLIIGGAAFFGIIFWLARKKSRKL